MGLGVLLLWREAHGDVHSGQVRVLGCPFPSLAQLHFSLQQGQEEEGPSGWGEAGGRGKCLLGGQDQLGSCRQQC